MEIKGMNKIDVGMLPPSNGTFIEWGEGKGGGRAYFHHVTILWYFDSQLK